jgi:hypothetical protein
LIRPTIIIANQTPTAGSGKTILTSTIIDSLSPDHPNHLAYFYFDRINPLKSTPARLYGSIMAQILESHFPELPPNLEQHFDLNRVHQPLESELQDFLAELLEKVPGYTIVVDGLDECRNRLSLLQALPLLKARILVTANEEPDIVDELEYLPKLELTQDHVDADIAAFVQAEIVRQPTLRRLNAQTKIMVTDVIVGKRGTFRWVREALDMVAKRRTDRDIRDALQSLKEPEDDDGYDSGMGNGDDDDDDDDDEDQDEGVDEGLDEDED